MDVFSICIEKGGERLDRFLASHIQKSRAHVQSAIRGGNCRINDIIVYKPSQTLHAGDRLEFRQSPEAPSTLIPTPGKLDILFEDDVLLVLNKSQDSVVHPGAGNWEGTLVHHLLYYLRGNPEFAQSSDLRPGIVHRLDKGTSGVLLVAKNRATLEKLSQLFKSRSVKKEYEAIIWGNIKSNGRFESLIGRDSKNRKKMSSKTKSGKPALTFWNKKESLGAFSLVTLLPETGRTHQLRVHLEEGGFPILGDPLYGKGRLKRSEHLLQPDVYVWLKDIQFPFLHARSLSFAHPVTGKILKFEAPRPDVFETCLNRLRRNQNVD